MNVLAGCGFPAYRPVRFVRPIGRVGAARNAMARAHDSVVARGLRRGRPGTVLERDAVARQGEAVLVPCQPTAPERASAFPLCLTFYWRSIGTRRLF